MRRVEILRLVAVSMLGVAAVLIVPCVVVWALQLQSLNVVLLAALGPLVLIAYALMLIVRARLIERRLMDRIDQ